MELGGVLNGEICTSMKMPTANKSLELSAKVVIRQVDTLSRKSRCLDFDSGRQLNSMLGVLWVLSEHIVDRILSTSLTLFRATLSPRGEGDALEGTVSDGREGKFH